MKFRQDLEPKVKWFLTSQIIFYGAGFVVTVFRLLTFDFPYLQVIYEKEEFFVMVISVGFVFWGVWVMQASSMERRNGKQGND